MNAILSPHLDDAVLSCWSVLTGRGPAIVVNVFTGAPVAASGTRWWDRMTGADDSAERMQERLAEDRAALALAGIASIDLALLEAQYREDAAEPGLAPALRQALPSPCTIYAPASMADHTDHTLVRDAALRLHDEGFPVRLYADLPHAITEGWPTWLADGAGSERASAQWDLALRSAGIGPAAASAHVVTLDPEAKARKIDALRAYATQLEALNSLAFRPMLYPETLRYEVFWPLA